LVSFRARQGRISAIGAVWAAKQRSSLLLRPLRPAFPLPGFFPLALHRQLVRVLLPPAPNVGGALLCSPFAAILPLPRRVRSRLIAPMDPVPL